MAKREPEFDPEHVRYISVAVYRRELGEEDLRRMLEKDGDGGIKLRERASSYDRLTRSYLAALTSAKGTS